MFVHFSRSFFRFFFFFKPCLIISSLFFWKPIKLEHDIGLITICDLWVFLLIILGISIFPFILIIYGNCFYQYWNGKLRHLYLLFFHFFFLENVFWSLFINLQFYPSKLRVKPCFQLLLVEFQAPFDDQSHG